MKISNNTKVLILLRIKLNQNEKIDLLKPKELRSVICYLQNSKLEPKDLVKTNQQSLALNIEKELGIKAIRLNALLNRGISLGFSLNNWSQLGIWVISIFDKEYPIFFRIRNRKNQPFLIFGCGDINIINSGGLAVIGSRNANNKAIKYAFETGRKLAQNHITIISGGAKGIDSSSVDGSLINNGKSVIVSGSDLERMVVIKKFRDFIMDNKLTIISMEVPNARWTPGRAMARNKFIYILSNAALVVECEDKKGGTWSGAIENLKSSWVPLYVRENHENALGNEELLNRGASKDSCINLSKINMPSINYSELTINEIAIIEDTNIANIKRKITRKKISCLDYPIEKESMKEDSNQDTSKQIDLKL
jgi:DNA processing protein